MKDKPIKRVEEMQDVSRDHHHALLLSWKIIKGIDKNIEPERITKYVQWFRQEHLLPHFELEEKWVFPVLHKEDPLYIQALKEHIDLLDMSLKAKEYSDLSEFAEKLKAHVRFEERILFNKIQEIASQEQLNQIQKHHNHKEFCELTTDEFWK